MIKHLWVVIFLLLSATACQSGGRPAINPEEVPARVELFGPLSGNKSRKVQLGSPIYTGRTKYRKRTGQYLPRSFYGNPPAG